MSRQVTATVSNKYYTNYKLHYQKLFRDVQTGDTFSVSDHTFLESDYTFLGSNHTFFRVRSHFFLYLGSNQIFLLSLMMETKDFSLQMILFPVHNPLCNVIAFFYPSSCWWSCFIYNFKSSNTTLKSHTSVLFMLPFCSLMNLP